MSEYTNPGIRTPDTFNSAVALMKDFDKTTAMTGDKSPNGIDVAVVHELVIEELFGARELNKYRADGGLKNRSPTQVVTDIVGLCGDEKATLALVDKFGKAKLRYLMDEVGSRFPDGSVWPRPSDGYLELLERIERARKEEGRLIDDVIISSGHEAFINKTYGVWGVAPPTLLVADETMRRLPVQVPLDRLSKPSSYVMDIARNMWRGSYGIGPVAEGCDEDKSRIIYTGDDPEKDGLLAQNSGIKFVLLEREKSADDWRTIGDWLGLGDTATDRAI